MEKTELPPCKEEDFDGSVLCNDCEGAENCPFISHALRVLS
jgi:hypothetical protein